MFAHFQILMEMSKEGFLHFLIFNI